MAARRPRRRAARRGLGEFGRIEKFFAPLARSFPGARSLADDCAIVAPPRRGVILAKTDAIVGTIHVVGDEPPELVARKALRVNLSDLASKGARPFAYLLTLSTRKSTSDAWVARFAGGLARDQREFGLALIGGDSVTSPGPIWVSITMLGTAAGRVPRRGGARPGDDVYVSGTIGDAALGLLALRGRLGGLTLAQRAYLVRRYRLPAPRLAAGKSLARIVHAAMDISDGLVGDLGHICKWSRLGAVIEWPRVPLSPAAGRALKAAPPLRGRVLGGGDDYELLFTAAPARRPAIAAIARRLGLALTRIGRMTAGRGVRVIDGNGRDITPAHKGFTHG